MNSKQRIAAITGVVIVGLIAVRLLTRPTTKADASDETLPSAAVALVKRAPIEDAVTLSGAFHAYQEVDVHAKVAGYIRNIYVDVGDHVKTGQKLAVLEVPELNAEVAGAHAGLRRAKDSVTRAQSNVHSAESIYAAYHAAYTRLKQASETRPGLIAEQELDDSMAKDKDSEAKVESDKAALAEAQSQLSVAEADLQRMNAMEDYTHVTAPFAGVVTKRYADTGTMIQAGTSSDTQSMPVVQLAEYTKLRLVVPVPESAVPGLQLGSVVQVHVTAMNQDFEGKVARFADALNDETRTMHTEIDVKNPDGALKEGMYAEAKLILKQHKDVLTVPIQALERNSSGATVLIVDALGRVEKREVKLGVESSDRVEVVAGLADNDRVIVGNHSEFREGEKVQPKVVNEMPGSEGGI
ncbi:MAG TPA: efflux RND transporter periplasmic adaptor subunit [Candidatus Sulfotelmatobacter sp.]|nr:efflux RND transporter periplasmic adaptor subunit [Candidatus Sulfotelmatobacter sp.]